MIRYNDEKTRSKGPVESRYDFSLTLSVMFYRAFLSRADASR